MISTLDCSIVLILYPSHAIVISYHYCYCLYPDGASSRFVLDQMLSDMYNRRISAGVVLTVLASLCWN